MIISIPEEVELHLQKLYDQHGELTPAIVVNDAKKKRSPLHNLFDWDVEKAAMAFWHDEARRLIRSVKIEFKVETMQVSTVSYTRNPNKPANEQGYVSLVDVKSDRDMASDVMATELQRAFSAIRRASAMAKYLDMEKDVELLLKKLDKLRAQIEAA